MTAQEGLFVSIRQPIAAGKSCTDVCPGIGYYRNTGHGNARPVRAADKLRVAYVAPSVSLSLPWLAKESGILAKHDLAAEILLITGARDWSSRSSLATSM